METNGQPDGTSGKQTGSGRPARPGGGGTPPGCLLPLIWVVVVFKPWSKKGWIKLKTFAGDVWEEPAMLLPGGQTRFYLTTLITCIAVIGGVFGFLILVNKLRLKLLSSKKGGPFLGMFSELGKIGDVLKAAALVVTPSVILKELEAKPHAVLNSIIYAVIALGIQFSIFEGLDLPPQTQTAATVLYSYQVQEQLKDSGSVSFTDSLLTYVLPALEEKRIRESDYKERVIENMHAHLGRTLETHPEAEYVREQVLNMSALQMLLDYAYGVRTQDDLAEVMKDAPDRLRLSFIDSIPKHDWVDGLLDICTDILIIVVGGLLLGLIKSGGGYDFRKGMIASACAVASLSILMTLVFSIAYFVTLTATARIASLLVVLIAFEV